MAGRRSVLAAALSVVAMLCCAPAFAQTNLRDHLTARPSAGSPVAKYVAGDDREFVLDRSGPSALLKFEGDDEVWALRPSPGPRGDVIYRDDTGRPVVRATRLGGVTVFTPDRPGGLPAALAGQASRIRPAAVSAVQLLRHLARQSVRASRALGRRIDFDALDVSPGEEVIYADAASVAADALTEAAQSDRARAALRNVRRVELAQGARPDVGVAGDTVRIVVAPPQGHAGRPSSRRILRGIGGD